MCYIATLLAVLLLSRTTAGNDTNDFDGVVRPDKDGTYSAYMIPPYETNHASTIEQLPDGTLLAAWFSGRHEEANRLAIVFARLPAGSKQWTNATTVSVQDGYANQNPVLFYDHAANVIRLFHSHAKAESGESKSVIYHLESSDNGTTWSTPTLFKPGSFSGAFPRNRIIPALDGGLIFPIYNAATNTAMMLKSSNDKSRSKWIMYNVKDSDHLVQPTVIRENSGIRDRLRAWFRDRRAMYMYTSTSNDDGKTWSKPMKAGLPNPNVGIEAFGSWNNGK